MFQGIDPFSSKLSLRYKIRNQSLRQIFSMCNWQLVFNMINLLTILIRDNTVNSFDVFDHLLIKFYICKSNLVFTFGMGKKVMQRLKKFFNIFN